MKPVVNYTMHVHDQSLAKTLSDVKKFLCGRRNESIYWLVLLELQRLQFILQDLHRLKFILQDLITPPYRFILLELHHRQAIRRELQELAECSKLHSHLLDKITVLEATVDMYIFQKQHTVNSTALFHDQGVFEMLFIAIGASIRTFFNYLCPMLMIDVAHLKGLYKGTNLVDVAMDGNNQIVPIAFGICKGETGPCWSWWMSVLRECISVNPNLLFISDRHAAIAMAVENEFPLAFMLLAKTLSDVIFLCGMRYESRLLVGSPGASTTPIYSPGSSSTPIYSLGSSTPPCYSPGASTPPSYSLGTSRNA
ncbi:transposase, MuDR, MULE transposase domain protein [Tanacetum coccineum]